MTLADSIRQAPHTKFVAEMYTPPEPHLFIPFGVESSVPQRDSYDAKLVMREPERHLSVTWAQVYP